jgi:hypothetical protein
MAAAKTPPRPLSWRSVPSLEYPGRSVVALAALGATAAAIYFLWQSPVLAVVGAVVLLASLHGHFLPRRYELDDEGVTVSVMWWNKRRPWDHFHAYYADRFGVMLTTFSYPSRLDTFRGVNLRFGRANRDDVITFVAAKLPRAEKKKAGGGDK